MRTRRYTPAQGSPRSLEEVRRYFQDELEKIAEAFQTDTDEIGDSSHRRGEALAQETGLLVWVNRAGVLTLDRVSIGAADSGGVGYRVLRVVN